MVAAGAAGCDPDPLDEVDGIFHRWGSGERVLCAANLDDHAGNELAGIGAGLDRARDRGEVIQLYAHKPGATIGLDRLEAVLAAIDERDLPFVTYAELADDDRGGPGVALSFDDNAVEAWWEMRELLAAHDARVTFFVSRYARLQPAQRDRLRDLAALGHAIEAHSVSHLRGPDVVENEGLAYYLATEALPSIERLRADGYPVRAFAYPFGARTSEMDHVLLQHVDLVRAVSFSRATSLAMDPCPR